MSDLTENLHSLSFESGLSEDEKGLVYLRARSAARTFCGCAHAVFLCQLIRALRSSISKYSANKGGLLSRDVCVGIVGMGHLGKQLLLTLLDKTNITASNIKISTRRPEYAGKHVPPGVECFFDNKRLVHWADVVFLCCLPSHLPRVCTDLSSHLSRRSIVYSFPSAVPVSRLVQLLGHNFVLTSQLDFTACNPAVWMTCTHLTSAFKDPSLVKLSCPLNMDGGLSSGLNWVCAVLYSLINICSSLNVGSTEALSLINQLFKLPQSMKMNVDDIVSSSCASRLSTDEPFPWISVSDAQTKETPLYYYLSNSKSTQQSVCVLYTALLESL